MADTIIDKLQIEIGSSAGSASKDLDALSKSLLGMNKSLGVLNRGKFGLNAEKIAAGYKGIASAVKAIDVNKINSISDGLSNMAGASSLSESAKQMKTLGDVTRSVKRDVDSLASSTRKLNFWEDPIKMANLEKYGATDPEGHRKAFEKAYGRQPGETYTTPNTRVGGDWYRTAKAVDEATESVKRFNDESRKSEAAPAVSVGITNFLSGIKDKVSGVNSLSDSFSRLWRSISLPLAEKAGLGNLQEMTAELKHYQRLMKDMENGFTVVGKGRGRREEPVDFDAKEYGLASKRVAELTSRIKEYKSAAGGIPAIASKAGAGLRAMVTGFENGFKSIPGAIQSLLSGIGKMKAAVASVGAYISGMITRIPVLGRAISSIGQSLSGLSKKITRLGHTFSLMVMRRALYAVLTEMKSAFDSFAAYSNKIGSAFNTNISSAMGGLQNFAAQLVAAFAPIYNYVAPAINYLISLLNAAASAIAQFFAALTGHGTWTKASVGAKNYGASVGSAASGAKKAAKAQKELNQQLMGFDRLNVINTPKDNDSSGSGGGGGGGGGGAGITFTPQEINPKIKEWVDKLKAAWKSGDFSGIGEELGKKLRDALNSIDWKKIQKTAEKIGKALGTLLAGIINTRGLPQAIGTTIAQALNTLLLGLDKFVKHVPWYKFGWFIGTSLNTALTTKDAIHGRTVAQNLGKLLSDCFNAAADLLFGVVNTFDWSELGNQINLGLNKFFETNTDKFKNFGYAVGGLVAGIATSIYEVVSKPENWSNIGQAIADAINGAIRAMGKIQDNGLTGWENLFGDFAELIKGIKNTLKKAFKEIDWGELKKGLGRGLKKFFKSMDAGSWEMLIGTAVLLGAWNGLKLLIQKKFGGSVSLAALTIAFKAVKFAAMKGAALVLALKNKIAEAFGLSGISGIEIAGGAIAIGLTILLTYELLKDNGAVDKAHDFFEERHGGVSERTKTKRAETDKKLIDASAAGELSIGAVDPNKTYETGKKNGKQIVNGVLDGIGDAADGIRDAVQGFFDNLWETFCGIFGIHSPAESMKPIGENILLGVIEGFRSKFDDFKKDVQELPKKIREWVKGKISIEAAIKLVKDGWKTVSEWIKTHIGGKIEKGIQLLREGWKTVSEWVKTHIGGKVEKGIQLLKDGWKTVAEWVKTHIGEKVEKGIELIREKWTTVAEWVKTHIGTKVEKGIQLIKEGWKTVANWVKTYIGAKVSKAIDLAKNGWTTVASWVKNHIGGTVSIAINLTKGWIGSGAKKLKELLGLATGGIYIGGQWKPIQGYANGGYPTSAQLFMAREAGPELVGTIGSHTAVMNNDQIVSSVAAGVADAIAGYVTPILRQMSRDERYLAAIAAKDFSISGDDIFDTMRSKGREHAARTGQQAFVY